MSLLAAPDPNWPVLAQTEIDRWHKVGIEGLRAIHHIGSTAVPGLVAKPTIDLLPVFESPAACDAAQSGVEAMGYEWMGAFGLPGRRYCRRDDPATGVRLVQAHAYPDGHADIARHLAFRDWLRALPQARAAYAAEKLRCAAAHPADRGAYGDCKSPWIAQAEAAALDWAKEAVE